MKWPGKRVLRRLGLVIATPLVLWAAVLLLLPMGWARRAVVSALVKATGQDVELDSVRLKPLGGVALSGLRIAAHGSHADPWLRVASLGIDVSLRDLLTGRIDPTACTASGVTLRVHRDSEGRLEFDDLLKRRQRASRTLESTFDPEAEDREIAITLANSTVSLIDDATMTRLVVTEVGGHATHSRSASVLNDLVGRLNGGHFEAAARLDHGTNPTLSASARVREVEIGAGMNSLAVMIPLLAPAQGDAGVRGRLSSEIMVNGRADSADVLGRTLRGRGEVHLDRLSLDDSRILNEVQVHLPVPTRGKTGALDGNFTIEARRVTTSDTVLMIGKVPVKLIGWSDFDGGIDYLVRSEKLGDTVSKLAHRLPSEAKELLADLPMDELETLAEIRIGGTIDHPRAAPAGLWTEPGKRAVDRRAAERAKLKEVGRRLLDRVLR